MTRRCTTCAALKPLAAFVRSARSSTGYRSTCRACRRDYTAQWRLDHPGYQRAYDVTRKGRTVHRRGAARQRKAHPERVRAQNLLRYAVRSGGILKPVMCPVCQLWAAPRHMNGHHPDYSKPLDVEWMCLWCHRDLHKLKD